LHPAERTSTIDGFEQELRELTAIASRFMPDRPTMSLALLAERGLRTVARTEDRAEVLDRLQADLGESPFLDAVTTGQAVSAADLANESRWPRCTARLVEQGVRGLHVEPVGAEGQVLGAFTLYSGTAGEVAAETRSAVRLAAAHVGILHRMALKAARMTEVATQLREALATREIIDQALGIVMGQHRCTAHDAFDILRRISQHQNRKLYEVAFDLVREVSGSPPPRHHFDDPG
jgi:GAF domain-containing protein